MSFDISLPNMPENGIMTEKQAQQIIEHLFSLQEYLRYMFAHIDSENLTESLLERIDMAGENDAILRRIEDGEGNLTRLTITAKGLSTQVQNVEGDVSQLSQRADQIELSVSDIDGAVTTLTLATGGLVAAVDNNRLAFTKYGLTILNADGQVVFSQDNQTGDLTISGIIRALAGVIGGFTIQNGSLVGNRIILDPSSGVIQLNNLSIYDTGSSGAVFDTSNTLGFYVNGQMRLVVGSSLIEAKVPLQAMYGFTVNPGRTTTQPPNAYIDPSTGELMRSTYSGGGDPGGGTDPGGNQPLVLYCSTVPANVQRNEIFYLQCGVSGGAPPYTKYQFKCKNPVSGKWDIVYEGPDNYIGPFASDEPSESWEITAWDSKGNNISSILTFTVHSGVGSSMTLYCSTVPATVVKNQIFYLQCGVSGGTPPYTKYQFKCKNPVTSQWDIVYEGPDNYIGPFASDEPSESWEFTAWDSQGNSVSRTLTFTVH